MTAAGWEPDAAIAHGILQDQPLRATDRCPHRGRTVHTTDDRCAGTVPGRDSMVRSRRSKLVN